MDSYGTWPKWNVHESEDVINCDNHILFPPILELLATPHWGPGSHIEHVCQKLITKKNIMNIFNYWHSLEGHYTIWRRSDCAEPIASPWVPQAPIVIYRNWRDNTTSEAPSSQTPFVESAPIVSPHNPKSFLRLGI